MNKRTGVSLQKQNSIKKTDASFKILYNFQKVKAMNFK